jgi:hypothetical protein
MGRQLQTLLRMNERVEELIRYFEEFVEHFNNTPLFSGPSLYFHKKVISILSRIGLQEAIGDNLFLEYLYATLASWGLHRMGDTNTKLVDFENFKGSIQSNRDEILKLKDERITHLDSNTSITGNLGTLIENLKIGEGETKLIFNSKTLHHLLPNLIPPIDRQYTLLFFYNSTGPPYIENCFSEIYPKFVEIALSRKGEILKTVGVGFHTSETKVVDNAIVGYVLKKNLKEQKKKKSLSA